MTDNQLVEILPEDWPELCALFRRNWPEHVFAYGLVSNYIKWKQKSLMETNVQIFSLNGTWSENGTFLLFDEFEIYFYSMDVESGYKSLSDALCLVKWEGYREVSMDFLEKHRAALDVAISEKSLFVAKDTLTNFYYKSKEVVARDKVDLEGLRFDRVTVDQLDHIYNQWPLRTSISQDSGYNLLKRLILLNESIGLFNTKDGSMLSWCLRDQTGAFSDLQTMETHLRKGYGRAVVSEFSRQLAVQGEDSYAFVLASNERSCKLFESCGFTKITHLHWVVVRQNG
ncbi:hypothetical protein quinque_010755 [Culex quinquefasciatus]|uniref:uncharacterized protein LOC6031254 n=1 Tax=Culex quinquefasciatus TaxID=7176 RepID=UPI0018E29F98|nr:uncharacterized protein LOC6031254 [Culex quinquefasciatus]